MGNDVAPAFAGLRGSRREVGAEELTQGLLLVRASAIKVVRFQLAMERRDRRVALEAVDDLVVLDRKIEDFLNDIPGSSESLSALERELDEQRQALVREKFTLAAGTMVRPAVSSNEARDLPPEVSLDDELVLDAFMEPMPPAAAFGKEPRFSSRLLAACLMFVLLALATGAFLFLSGTGAALLHGALP
jgi:hypothetical protein